MKEDPEIIPWENPVPHTWGFSRVNGAPWDSPEHPTYLEVQPGETIDDICERLWVEYTKDLPPEIRALRPVEFGAKGKSDSV